ncbi:MAG: CBS and ACT domain-containing protein [Desulfatibacillaceae bacterium]
MLVKNWMTKDVITVDVDTSMADAMQVMKDNNIQVLPVMKDGKLVGITTDRDLKKAWPSDATTLDVHELGYLVARLKIDEVMKTKVITVPSDYTVEETAEILDANTISGVPVVDRDGSLVGIITKSDIFRLMVEMTGLGKKGFQIAIRLKDEPGHVQQVRDIVRRYSGKVFSKLTQDSTAPEGYMDTYFRAAGIDRDRWEACKKELEAVGELLYVVDHRTGDRMIYKEV